MSKHVSLLPRSNNSKHDLLAIGQPSCYFLGLEGEVIQNIILKPLKILEFKDL